MKGSERAVYRKAANSIDPILHIGKEGVTDAVIAQADDALEARELIKCTVQRTCDIPVKDAAHEVAQRTEAECIQVIGRRFVLYRKKREDA